MPSLSFSLSLSFTLSLSLCFSLCFGDFLSSVAGDWPSAGTGTTKKVPADVLVPLAEVGVGEAPREGRYTCPVHFSYKLTQSQSQFFCVALLRGVHEAACEE